MSKLKIVGKNDLKIESPIQRLKRKRQPKRKKVGPSKFITSDLGTRLREWRKREKLNLTQLAKKLRIGITTISEIETNKSLPSAETLASLHIHTNLNILWLMFREGKMFQEQSENQVVQAIRPAKPKKVVKKTIFNMTLAELSKR